MKMRAMMKEAAAANKALDEQKAKSEHADIFGAEEGGELLLN
jgi:hypothetical protein